MGQWPVRKRKWGQKLVKATFPLSEGVRVTLLNLAVQETAKLRQETGNPRARVSQGQIIERACLEAEWFNREHTKVLKEITPNLP